MASGECPVCRTCWAEAHRPRIFPCGHSVCEACMRAADAAERVGVDDALTVYRCPLCRAETVSPWGARPVNHALCEVAGGGAKTAEPDPEEPPWRGNLAVLSLRTRRFLAAKLLEELTPVLRDAAARGLSHVIVRGEPARRANDAGAAFTQALFEAHGVYGVDSNKRELIVHLIATNTPWRGIFINENYRSQLGDEPQEGGDRPPTGLREQQALHTRSVIARMIEAVHEEEEP